MKKKVALISLLVLAVMLIASCAAQKTSDSIVGKWKSEQSQQVIEFTADGLYKGIQQTHYTYEIIEGKQIKIINPEYADGSDAITMDFTIKGDVLSTTVDGTTITWKRQ